MTTIVIIGRPNVGKSTLFNRLVGRRLALVHDRPGVTRDWRKGSGQLGALTFDLIDTAGIDDFAGEGFDQNLQKQTLDLLKKADLCLFVYDARQGLLPQDELLARWVRKTGCRALLLANKCEGLAQQRHLEEAYRLGFGDPISCSGAHGLGLGDLETAISSLIDTPSLKTSQDTLEQDSLEQKTSPIKLAIIGRPNAGKSTLINQLLGEDRFLTGPEAGVTRDSIGVEWSWQGRPVILWDTAGIRRKSRIEDPLESLSVGDSFRAIAFCDIAVLMIDALCPFEKQDLLLADHVLEQGRGLVLAFNKWDRIGSNPTLWKTLHEKVEETLPQGRGAEKIKLSGLSGFGVSFLMPAVLKTYDRWNTRLSTGKLNRWLEETVDRYPPPAPGGRRLKLRYITQAKARPPTFILFCSQQDGVPETYLRYLTNRLREDFGLWGVPIRIHTRSSKNPYQKNK